MVSEAWRDLDPDEREKWEGMARRDKARYDVERAMYKGPWKVPANKRTPKDPSAPKRPMSAFLAFSNSRRAMVKRENPDATNAEISKRLSNMWKEAPDDLRQQYIDEEYEKRQQYKIAMADWRTKFEEEKRAERQVREEMALRAAEESEQSVYSRNADDNDSEDVAPRASYPFAEPDNYLTASSHTHQQHQQLLSSQNAASLYGMGALNPYFSSLNGFGGAFGPSLPPLGGSRLNDVEHQLAAYNQLGQLNSLFSESTTTAATVQQCFRAHIFSCFLFLGANFAPNAATLNQLGQGLSVYPQLDGGNEALAYDYNLGQLQGSAAAAQLRSQGQYPYGNPGSFPPGWNFRGNI